MDTKLIKTFPFLAEFRTTRGAKGGFRLLDGYIPEETRDCAGVYIIESSRGFKFPYPCGKSTVIYIGKSDNLMARLKEHRQVLLKLDENPDYGMKTYEPWVSSRYQYMNCHGARVYYYKCQGQQDAKNLESRIMWDFYSMYRALPVENAAKSYTKE